MLTKDFHSPKDTKFLWVYEGLTQYLGELIEARCGLMSQTEFRHRITVELRRAVHQQGRQWRTLTDTAAASHILRDKSPNWSGLRRSQDYYMEGMLFWLEADAIIRRNSDGARSLDDFCQKFLGSTSALGRPLAFTREDVIRELRAVANLDWDSLIRRRTESLQEQFDPTVASLLGYEFRLMRKAPNIPAETFRHQSGVDVLDSLGMVLSQAGDVQNLLIGSPADRARLGPAMKVIGVNGRKWSGSRLVEALIQSQDQRPIDLLVADGDELRTIQLHYYDGPRYWSLVRQEQEADLLGEILKAK
jgi:predicted metalloprotease with PDZ domain